MKPLESISELMINHVTIKISKQTRGPKSAGKAVKGAKRGNVTVSVSPPAPPPPPHTSH